MTKDLIRLTETIAKCPYCGNEWEPRSEEPKSCPRCKRPFGAFSSRTQFMKIVRTEQNRLPNFILCGAPGCTELAMYNVAGVGERCLVHYIEFLNTQRQLTREELLNKTGG